MHCASRRAITAITPSETPAGGAHRDGVARRTPRGSSAAHGRWLLVALTSLALVVSASTAVPAVAASNAAMAWGENRYGELGNDSKATSDVPVQVSGLGGVVAVAGGGYNDMAVLSDGTVMGWGLNGFGQLCNGTQTKTDVPVPMRNVDEAVAVSAGSYHTVILMGNGTVEACGANFFGQLGDGSSGHATGSTVPVAVSGLSGVTAVSAKGDTSLALLSDGTVMAWGKGDSGQLGNGAEVDSDVPVAVSGLSGVTAISAGHKYALALLSDGTVMAWGENKLGQLGDGTMADSDVPVSVAGLSEVTAISAGGNASLALLRDGTVMAWGDNRNGQLGNASAGKSDVPRPVVGLPRATAVSAGGEFGLALLSTGKVMSWGKNTFGQLGDGTTTNSATPVAVSGLSEVVGIAAIDSHDSFAYGPSTQTLPAPAVTELSPKDGPVVGATAVTIVGTNLTGATSVEFGSVRATNFTVTSPTSIVALAPPELAGSVDVTVTTPIATSVVSSHDRFGYKPAITKLTPSLGTAAGGTRVTVSGSGFAVGASATSFVFGETGARSADCASTTSCVVVAPAHAAGKVQVRASVNEVNTAKTSADVFTYD
jgi:alpha-tubulin suppressor-like RCC1 family protein